MEKLPSKKFGAILADPPWHFRTWSHRGKSRHADRHYKTMTLDEIEQLDVARVAKRDCVLFLWATWPQLEWALHTIQAWGFRYKTCAFAWVKADVSTLNMFAGPVDADIKCGYWTRSNSEVCLLATRGKPKRLDGGVRQGIIEPAREHSRKPDCVHSRIERLVRGPYLELFARQKRPGWTAWGNETEKFNGNRKKEIDGLVRVLPGEVAGRTRRDGRADAARLSDRVPPHLRKARANL